MSTYCTVSSSDRFVERLENSILVAEGNADNRSAIIERPIDEHIRAYFRIPDGYKYSE